jgi:hypothetical protein
MLGNHDGLTPINDTSAIIQPAVVAMAHLKAGKSVPERKKILIRASAQISDDDRYWPESLASRLTEGGVDAAPAHLIALKVAAELRDDETAALIRETGKHAGSEFSQMMVQGIAAVDATLLERLRTGQADENELFARVAIAHFFRRDPQSIFHVSMIDMAVKKLHRVWKGGMNDFVAWAIQRPDSEPAPEGAVGYLVVQRELSGKQGLYLYGPSEEGRAKLQELWQHSAEALGVDDEQRVAHACLANIYHNNLMAGDMGTFHGVMEALLEKLEMPFALMHARSRDGDIATSLRPIPASSVEEARRVVHKMPEVQMFETFRQMSSVISSVKEDETLS